MKLKKLLCVIVFGTIILFSVKFNAIEPLTYHQGSEVMREQTEKYYQIIPQNVKESLMNNNVTINITSENIF